MSIVDPRAAEPLDWSLKGTPPEFEGRLATSVGQLGRSLFDDALFFPVAVLREATLQNNSRWMRRFVELSGVKIAPHGKTTMAPALFQRQLADGAWGLTAATIQHVRAYRRFGIKRILMANQLVGKGAIGWLADELAANPEFDFYCLVDSEAGVAALHRVAQAKGVSRPIQVLIEVGFPGGRAGTRTLDAGLCLARAVQRARPFLRLGGVETFEGVFQVRSDGESRARAMLDLVAALTVAADAEGLFDGDIVLSGGGSAFYDLAAQTLSSLRLSRPHEVVIRSGCYLTHDSDMYRELYAALKRRSSMPAEIGFDLEPALQVWAHVQSIPEPGRMICGMGRRDVGYDAQPPRLLSWARPGDLRPRAAPPGFNVSALNDQHAFVDGPVDSLFQVGDLVGFGISHPCTTFDKWRALLMVDESWMVRSVVRTYF
ncbi:MAG: amino acid deaminase [Gammaproteobacteria bacterium]